MELGFVQMRSAMGRDGRISEGTPIAWWRTAVAGPGTVSGVSEPDEDLTASPTGSVHRYARRVFRREIEAAAPNPSSGCRDIADDRVFGEVAISRIVFKRAKDTDGERQS